MGFQKDKVKRNIDIFKRHLGGETNSAIGRQYGISDEAVRNVMMTFYRTFQHPRYTDIAPYPFSQDKVPRSWTGLIDRRALSPEEKEQDKAYWLKMLDTYIENKKRG